MSFLKQSMETFNIIIKERNKHLIYVDESHSYYIRKSELKKYHHYPSVSSITASKFPKFNADLVATKLSKTNKGKYKDKSKEEILKKWDKARENGTMMHELFDMYLTKNITYIFENNKYFTLNEFKELKRFEDDHKHYKVVKTELICYSIIFNLAGKFDVLYYDTIKKYFVLIDFKRCENLTINGYCACKRKYYNSSNLNEFLSFKHSEKCDLLGISISTKNMINSKYIKYSVSINLYRELLKEYTIIVEELFLLNFYKNRPYKLLSVAVDENLIKNFNPGL